MKKARRSTVERADSRDHQLRIVRLGFGGLALVATLTGIVIWQFADELVGLDEDAQLIVTLVATICVIIGIGALLVATVFWDRLFTRRS